MKKFQLLQQPINKQTGWTKGGDCIVNAMANDLDGGLDYQFGNIFVFDKSINSFEPFYSFHVWNTNEDGTIIYDNLHNLKNHTDELGFICPQPSDWKILVIDGTNEHHLGSADKTYYNMVKRFDKLYKGKSDAVYVIGLGYKNDRRTRMYWEDVEEVMDELERNPNKIELMKEQQDKFVGTPVEYFDFVAKKEEQDRNDRMSQLQKQFPNAMIYIA